MVDKFGYYHCNTSNPISTFNHGNTTVVNLDKPGPIYFISGDPNHCKDGQRLVIEVMSLHQVAHSPPSIANPPDSAMSPSSLSGSGVSDSVTLVSVSVAVIATSVTLFSAPFPFVSYVWLSSWYGFLCFLSFCIWVLNYWWLFVEDSLLYFVGSLFIYIVEPLFCFFSPLLFLVSPI